MIYTSLVSGSLVLIPLWLLYQLADFVAKLYFTRAKFQRMQREGLVSRRSGTVFCCWKLRGHAILWTDKFNLANAPTSPIVRTPYGGWKDHVEASK